MKNTRRPLVIVLVLSVMLLSIACTFSNLIPQIDAEGVAATAAAAIPLPIKTDGVPTLNIPTVNIPTVTLPTLPAGRPTTAAGRPTIAVQATLPANSADMVTGLDKLDSYRMTYKMTITGKDTKGADAKQELNLLQEQVKSKESTHMSMQGTGWAAGSDSGGFEIYQVGNMSYMVTSAKGQTTPSCISFSSDKPIFDKNQLLTPEEMIGEVQKENLVARGETVNGVKADHYKVQKAALGFGTATSQSGDIWIAQDGGYMVKLTSEGTGDFSLSTDKITGKVVLNYDLTEINKLASIVLPAACSAATDALKDLPVPPNATDKSSFGEMLTFNSPDAPKTVADYFRKELIAKGWKITNDSAMDVVVMISIQKDTRKFQVMITPGDKGGSSVIITKMP